MALDIPHGYEPQIEQVAQAQHITADEALDRILQAGLKTMTMMVVSPRDLIGAFSSPEDMAAADYALDIAMKDRERRNAQAPHA